MNYAIVFKLQSMILGILAISFALAFGISRYYVHSNGEALASSAFAISFLLALTLAIGCYILGKTGKPTLFRKEALAVIGIGWILASLVGAIPYYLILPDIHYAGAIFESASGLTTTGASVINDLESLPRSLHFWRGFSQWIGGLGVVVFFVAILSSLGAGAKVLFSRESSAQATDLGTSRVQSGVLRLLIFYLGLSVLCTGVFWLCGLEPFEACIHMFTTLSTGGFSTRSASVAAFNNPLLEWMMILFMAIGGTSFLALVKAFKGDFSSIRESTEIRAYYAIFLFATLAILLFLQLDPNTRDVWSENLRDSAFQVISILTTTGYATEDFDQWVPVTHSILLILMIVGGCSGSTAGGTKVIRMVVTGRICLHQVEKAYRPHVVRPLKVNGRSLGPEDQNGVLVFIAMVSMVVLFSQIIVAFLEPSMSFTGSLSAMFACLFNIGPGLAEVGPTKNFSGFHDYTKLYLSFLMILGRLELFALLALLTPGLWRRF